MLSMDIFSELKLKKPKKPKKTQGLKNVHEPCLWSSCNGLETLRWVLHKALRKVYGR